MPSLPPSRDGHYFLTGRAGVTWWLIHASPVASGGRVPVRVEQYFPAYQGTLWVTVRGLQRFAGTAPSSRGIYEFRRIFFSMGGPVGELFGSAAQALAQGVCWIAGCKIHETTHVFPPAGALNIEWEPPRRYFDFNRHWPGAQVGVRG